VLLSYAVSGTGLLALLALSNGFFFHGIWDGLVHVPAQLLTETLPLSGGSSLLAAPIVLLSDSLMRIEDTFRLARRTVRVVRQNLFWAFFYNAAGIALAVAGVLNPILAAGAMVLSSLSVIGNSLRLGRPGQ